MGVLGCGSHRVLITCRGGNDDDGGGELWELPFGSLNYGRVLDDMSSARVVVTDLSLSSLRADVRARCCGILNELEPWVHEMAVWRSVGHDDSLVWVGPVVGTEWHNDVNGSRSVTIDARDLGQWFERRLEERNRSFVGVDAAVIFRQIVSDALHRDVTPNIDFSSISPTGVIADRELKIEARRRAADDLRELANTAVDYTMIGRRLIAGGTEVPTAELGKLVNEHFSTVTLKADGLQTETESTVVGSPPENMGGPVVAVAGGVEAVRGLLQGVVNEAGIQDHNSAQALADTRHLFLQETPRYVEGVLTAEAPVDFGALIPGARTDLRLGFLCRDVVGDHRLRALDVGVSDLNVETITARFTTAGTGNGTFPEVIPSGPFTDWSYPSPGTGTSHFGVTMRPEVEPSQSGYIYFAHVFGFLNDTAPGCYFGLQTHGLQPDGTDLGHVALWSGFDTIDHVAGPGAIGIHHTEGNGGDQCMLPYAWVPNHSYRFHAQIVAAPPGKTSAAGDWWECTVSDLTAATANVIGYIQQVAAWGLGKAFTYSFSENYGPRPVACYLLPYCSTVFSDAFVDSPGAPRYSSSHYNHIGYAPGQCDNTRVDDLGPLSVRHLWGDGVTP